MLVCVRLGCVRERNVDIEISLDSRCQGARFMSHGIPRLIFAVLGISCKRRDDRRRDELVGLPASCRTASQRSPLLQSECYVGVKTIGVEVLGVGLPASCGMASQGPSSLYSVSCVGVGMMVVGNLDVGWSASYRIAC
jgi:hypothetical protein